MNKLSRFWTASIAYVALGVGAGLSIMYNVLQTMTIRGAALGAPDIVTAVAMPGIVVLMVELFVSNWWVGRPWYMQAVRVLATATIGGVAMRASWVHGHDWMLGHGHAPDVAVTWPLAIDLLAILATALILAGRRTGHVATNTPVATVATPPLADWDMDKLAATLPADLATDGTWRDLADPVATQPLSEDYAAKLAKDIADFEHGQTMTARPTLPVVRPAAPGGLPSRIPAEARELLAAWNPDTLSGPAVDELLAAHFGKSRRTVRRWRAEVTGRPVSGA